MGINISSNGDSRLLEDKQRPLMGTSAKILSKRAPLEDLTAMGKEEQSSEQSAETPHLSRVVLVFGVRCLQCQNPA